MTDTTVTTASAAPSDGGAASTATAPAAATTSTASTPSSASGGESSTAPLIEKGISYEEVDKRFDAQLAKETAAVAEKKTETNGEQKPESTTADKPEEPKPEEEVKAESKEEKPAEEQGDEDKAPPKVREALKVIPDAKLRKQLAENYYIAEAYKRSGMPLSQIHQYLEFGTLEDLATMRQHTEVLQAISGDFESGDTSALDRLNGVLRTHSPQAYSAWISRAVTDLEETAPDAYQGIVLQGARNLLDNLRNDAQVENNEDYAVLAEELEKYLGWPTNARQAPQPPQSRLSPEEQRAIEEANQIRTREQQRISAEREAVHDGFLTQSFETAKSQALEAIRSKVDELADGYTDRAKQSIVDKVAEYVYTTAKKHPTAASTVNAMVKQGGYTQENYDRVVRYLTGLATGFIPYGLKTTFDEIAEYTNTKRLAREEKVERQQARREVGSGGAVPPPTSPRISGKGKTLEEVDKEFDRLYLNRI